MGLTPTAYPLGLTSGRSVSFRERKRQARKCCLGETFWERNADNGAQPTNGRVQRRRRILGKNGHVDRHATTAVHGTFPIMKEARQIPLPENSCIMRSEDDRRGRGMVSRPYYGSGGKLLERWTLARGNTQGVSHLWPRKGPLPI